MRSDLRWLLPALLLAALACVRKPDAATADPRPSGVEPAGGYQVRRATVLIRGSGFLARSTQPAGGGAPTVDTRHRVWLGDSELEEVTWIDQRTLQATVQAGLPVGTHALQVENALGRRGRLEAAFRIAPGTPPSLSSDLQLSTTLVTEGQSMEATLTVTNTGETASRQVIANLAAEGAGVLELASPPPDPQDLEPGASTTFRWMFTAGAAGDVTLTASGGGLDPVTGTALPLPTAEAGPVRVAAAGGVLALAARPSRARATVGQKVALDVELLNGRTTAANGVAVSAVLGGAGALALVSAPAAVDLGPGESRVVSFVYTAQAAGEVTFDVGASGQEAGSGRPLTAAPGSAHLAVQTPPALACQVAAAPLQVSAGQRVTLTATVTNAGGAAAAGVGPALASAPAGMALVAAPGAQDVPGGGSATFVLQVSTSLPGSGAVALDFSGTDANTGAAAVAPRATSPALVVQAPAALAAGISTSRAAAGVGQAFTLSLALSNSGGATANVAAVAPSLPAAVACSGPTPAVPLAVPGGQSLALAWSCVAGAAGTYALNATATWADANAGVAQAPLTPASPATVAVQSAASLAAAFVSPPSAVTVGQLFSLTLQVTNSGNAAARAVAPAAIRHCPGRPAAQDVAGTPTGSAATGATFVYTGCSSPTPGALTLSASASGTDANTGATVTTNTASVDVAVLAAANLSAAFDAHVPVASGEVFTLVLRVTNHGAAAANAVAPAAIAVCAGTPAGRAIAGGTAAAFTYTGCSSFTPGTLTLSASASGTDANTGATVTTNTASVDVAVLAAATLSAAFQAPPPASVNVDQSFNMTLRVTNTGAARAMAVAVTGLGFCASPGAQTIAGSGGFADFVYSGCRSSPAGTLALALAARGTDEVSGTAVTSNVATADVAVQTPAALTGSLSVAPDPVPWPGTFTVTLTITNGGQAAANGVTPTGFSISRADLVFCLQRAPTSGDIPGSGSPGLNTRAFTWGCFRLGTGDVYFSCGAHGTDANSNGGVDAPPVGASAALGAAGEPPPHSTAGAEAIAVATDPFGDATPLAFVTGFQGHAWVGPSRDGKAFLRYDPAAASAPAPAPIAIAADTGPSPASNLAWAGGVADTLGAIGCAGGTMACGPDGEAGPSLVFSGAGGGGESLAVSGPRYAYATSSADLPLRLGRSGLGQPATTGGAARGPAAGLAVPGPAGAAGRLVLGWAGPEPRLVFASTPALGAGLDARAGGDPLDLEAWAMPGVGLGAAGGGGITALVVFQGVLHAAGPGGLVRATVPEPSPFTVRPLDWAEATPSADAWAARSSAPVLAAARPLPGDRAVPRLTAFGACGAGPCLLAIRNVQGASPAVVPQLWSCDPAGGGDPGQCDPGDWSLVAPNDSGDTLLSQLGEPTNEAASVLAATARWLYLGFDNRTKGVQLYRTPVAPVRRGDFVGRGGCTAGAEGCVGLGGSGLGDPAATRFLDAAVVSAGGEDSLWLAVGDGAGPVRIVRIPD